MRLTALSSLSFRGRRPRAACWRALPILVLIPLLSIAVTLFADVSIWARSGVGLLAASIACGLLLAFFLSVAPAVEQTLLPSQPGPNKYGPNPNEVPL